MKNIHLLPTDKPSRLHYYNHFDPLGLSKEYLQWKQGRNIYITSDEQPKHNDYYTTDGKEIYYCNTLNPTRNNHYKKVILTTDQDLIVDGIQAIDDEFLEWFVKNPSCEFVEIEKTFVTNSGLGYQEYAVLNSDFKVLEVVATRPQSSYKIGSVTKLDDYEYVTEYKINIPQEEPKHITVKEPCSLCDGTGETTFSGTYTTQRKCDLCNGDKYWNKKILVDQPKQETLEDTAKKFTENLYYKVGDADEFNGEPLVVYDTFIAGAKWQAERMYSEEDFKLFARQYYREARLNTSNLLWDDLADKCLEQFKKK